MEKSQPKKAFMTFDNIFTNLFKNCYVMVCWVVLSVPYGFRQNFSLSFFANILSQNL